MFYLVAMMAAIESILKMIGMYMADFVEPATFARLAST